MRPLKDLQFLLEHHLDLNEYYRSHWKRPRIFADIFPKDWSNMHAVVLLGPFYRISPLNTVKLIKE